MKLYAVTGNPILHSHSPQIFNAIFEQMDIDARYLRLACNTAEEAIFLLKNLNLSGINITAPFKEKMQNHLTEIDTNANTIGSVNTIVSKQNKLTGYNTDYLGFNLLIEKVENYKSKNILVLGAGGTAKAVVHALYTNRLNVTIANRTIEKANNLAEKYNFKVIDVSELNNAITNYDIIINTLSEGISLFDVSLINKRQTVIDMNYKSSVYEDINSGKEMLVNQAYYAYQLYWGNFPDKKIMFNAFDNHLNKNKSISLIGLPASGKTEIGKLLATKLNYHFIDTDQEIEKKTGFSISELYQKKGEAYFRNIENEILKELVNENNIILATGGGTILNKENRQLLHKNTLPIWLFAEPKRSINRVSLDNRPAFANTDATELIEKLFNERKFLYAQIAEMVISTQDRKPNEIAEKIKMEVRSA